MTTHAMIDIETLGTNPDCVVLSVGAVKFDPYTGNEPYSKTLWRPSADEQLKADRSVDQGTLEWWGKQADHIREEAFSEFGRVDLDMFFKDLNRYLVGVDKIWCQGPQFDMVILEDLFRQFNHHRNWAYWQVCDCRTIFNMMFEHAFLRKSTMNGNFVSVRWKRLTVFNLFMVRRIKFI